jgi:hypothetical protein
MTFEQAIGTKFVPAFYSGNMVYALPFSTAAIVNVTIANGTQYLLESDELGASVMIAAIDHPNDTYVTLIGSGGADPSTLANGTSTAADVILKNGTIWTALNDATITFKVIDDGTKKFLVEESRS